MSGGSASSPVRSVDASDVVVIPPLTSSEAENVTALMAEFGVDYAHMDVLESRLASKLTALDHECVDIVMSAKSRADSASIVDRVESYCVTLDEMSLWLHHHDGELTRMRRGIELIESRNIALDTAERNFARLRDTLSALIDRITLPPHIERTLVRGDWATQTVAIINAARALADITSQRLDPRLETLSAVVQQRAAMQTLQTQFARDAVRFVQTALPAAATRRGEAAADAPSIGDTRIESNSAMHNDVSRHSELIALVRRFDVGALALLLSAYTAAAQKRSEANVKAFAAAVKRIVTTDRVAPPSHLLSQAEFVVGSGRRYAAQSNKASSGAVYRLFIRSLSAVVIEEQTFLAKVFFAETPTAEAAAAVNNATDAIFKCLLSETSDLVSAAIKFDPLSAIDVSTAIQANNDERTPPLVARIVDSIQKSSATAFAEFIDGEIAALNNLKFAAKQAGVLPPVNKFPSLLDRIDSIAAANKSAAADSALLKLVSAMSKWIEQIAKSDEKYGDVLVIENAHFLVSALRSFHPPMSIGASALSKFSGLYNERLLKYIGWHLEYECDVIVKFWNRLDAVSAHTSADDVQYATEISKADLRTLIRGHFVANKLRRAIENMYKRMVKHLGKNESECRIAFAKLAETFLQRFDRFVVLIGASYAGETVPVTHDEIALIFDSVAPSLRSAPATSP